MALTSLPQPTRAGQIEMSVSRNDAYRVLFMNNGSVVAERSIDQPMTPRWKLPDPRRRGPSDREFDVIRIVPSRGDSVYRLGHVRVVAPSVPARAGSPANEADQRR